MGSEEVSTPAKHSKPMETGENSSSANSCKSTVAYKSTRATSPPLFTPTAASSLTSHPCVWGNQGEVSTMPEAEANTFGEKDLETTKNCKGSSEKSGISRENGNSASRSENNGASQSVASGRKGSFDAASDRNASQGQVNEVSATKKLSYGQFLADGADAQNMTGVNLNLGTNMNASCNGAMRLKVRLTPYGVSTVIASAIKAGPQEVTPEKLIQDEAELKKLKRKMSNRESARKSRLRKQEECEQLQTEAGTLRAENFMLRQELMKISEECMKQDSENNSIMEELIQKYGLDALSGLDEKKNSTIFFKLSPVIKATAPTNKKLQVKATHLLIRPEITVQSN